MPFNRPTLKELDDRINNDIAGRVRVGTTARAVSLLRRSVVGVLSRAFAGACHLLYGFLAWLAKQRFVHSMEAEFLDAEGLTYDIPRKREDTAGGKIIVTGNNGAVVLLETLYQRDDGFKYRVGETTPIADGQAIITLEAVEPGTGGNLPAGSIVRLVTSVEGVQSEAVVDSEGLIGGVDVESDDYYRERILDRKRQPPHGGAKHDYEQWAKAVPGVTRAWCLPLWMGKGTVGVMFTRDNDPDPIPNKEQCIEVAAYIEKVRPVTAEVFVFPPVRQEIDVTVKLSPDEEGIRQAVLDELEDFILRDGEPDAILRVSRLSEAISTATGEHHHYLADPVNDIPIAKNAIPVLGQVVFIDNPAGG